MKKTEFATKVAQEITEQYNVKATVNEVQKNNGLLLTGITVGNGNICPTIYIDSHFERDCSVAYTVKDVYNTYLSNAIDKDFNFDELRINGLNHIVAKLVNYDSNKDFLTNKVYDKFLDLATVYMIEIDKSEFVSATITITDSLMDSLEWNKEIIARNWKTSNKEFEVKSMFETIFEMNPEMFEDLSQDVLDSIRFENSMYVISNKHKMYGATAMTDNDFLYDLYEQIGDFYILPSSIHECICVPAYSTDNSEELKELVTQINSTEVQPDKVLSNNVYYFDGETVKIA